ncbi:hypothetical protein EGO58_12450, partial [Limosilactobacillus reuteri]
HAHEVRTMAKWLDPPLIVTLATRGALDFGPTAPRTETRGANLRSAPPPQGVKEVGQHDA